MILQDPNLIREIINNRYRFEGVFKNPADPEVEQYFNSSPADSIMFNGATSIDSEKDDSSHGGTSLKQDTKKDLNLLSPLANYPKINAEERFKPMAVLAFSKQSTLSSMLIANVKTFTEFTVYITPTNDNMTIKVYENDTVGHVIGEILKEHKEQGMYPTLNYDSNSLYEIRMCEDGLPDMDMSALERNKPLVGFNITDCCLCEIEIEDDADSDFGSPSMAVSRKTGAPLLMDNDDNESPFAKSMATLADDCIIVTIPNMGQMNLTFTPQTTFRDLLPMIATHNKLRLYTEEYSLVMIAEEQKRLKLMSATVNMNDTVAAIGARQYELQLKTYADTVIPKQAKPMKAVQSQNALHQHALGFDFQYNDTTANAYEEWTVYKQHKSTSTVSKFIRQAQQRRQFGVDGKNTYNRKMDTNQQTGIPVRALSTVQNIEILSNNRTFCVKYSDTMYAIEYECENELACQQIYAKIKYLLKQQQRPQR